MRFMKLGTVALTIVLCSACSSVPSGPAFSGAEAAPENDGKVYVYRPERMFYMAVSLPVVLNGEQIGTIGNNGYFPLTLDPGTHTIATDSSVVDHKTEFTVQSGDVTFLRLGLDQKPALCYCSEFKFEPVARSKALEELEGVKRQDGIAQR